MRFVETPLPGLLRIEPQRFQDERGFFARTYCQDTFRERGLCTQWAQCSTSYNHVRGTLRGMHYQRPPHAEIKLVRCTQGAIFDVAIDLRRDSPTFKRWFGAELSQSNGQALYIPEGFAHGFLTLTDGAEVSYQTSERYHPESAAGVRADDPAFAIHWPESVAVISERDRSFEDFS